jgi:hypothetical protein
MRLTPDDESNFHSNSAALKLPPPLLTNPKKEKGFLLDL